ncbi:MAG: hypothetical protein JWN24_813 [Phycisphaerales bacterium]|jgi:type IV pilus biogenesis protein CpaD/CtpE|nr:hypothetical protein [Phycisphaerales bacterium]
MSTLHYVLAAFAAAAIAGCASTNSDGGKTSATEPNGPARMTAEAPTSTEMAAYAGAHVFPSNMTPSSDLRAAALVSADRNAIKVYNFSGEPLHDVEVWVNGAYVQRVQGIPASGSVTIRTINLYNGMGRNFASQSEPVSRVQVRDSRGLYNLLGPASE